MTIDELIAAAEAGPTDELLDDLVNEAKDHEAANINNSGVGEQIRYLTGYGFSVEQLRRQLGLAPR